MHKKLRRLVCVSLIGGLGIATSSAGSSAASTSAIRVDTLDSASQLSQMLEKTSTSTEFMHSGIYTSDNKYISANEVIAAAAQSSNVVRYEDGAIGLADPNQYTDGQQLVPRAGEAPPPAEPTPEDLALWRDIDAGKFVITDGMNQSSHASSTGPSPDLIIGTDNRYPITNTTQYSPNAISYLSTGLGQCSAEFYGNDIVVTAAHCLMLNGSWASGTWYVDRGRNGAPVYTRCYAQSWWVLGGWTYNQVIGNDLGAVRVNCWIPGTYGNGIFPLVSLPACPYNECLQSGWVNGYPGEKAGQQWEGYGVLTLSVTQPAAVIYSIDTSGGQSGGLVSTPCSSYGFGECQIGVHTQGLTETGFFYSNTINLAHKFQPADIVALAGWRGY